MIAYTDVLVANGYTETAGDAANRDRYRVRDAANLTAENAEDEHRQNDGDSAEA